MVKIIGAGPGAKDLITVRGMRALQEADVIIYAGSLVNEELLEYAKKECEIYNSAYMNLDEVIDVIVKAEQAGKKVVRLHTGDPSIYGAIREQIEVLATHGIQCEICPGVSSFLAAAAALNCEYTVPDGHSYENGRKNTGAGKRKAFAFGTARRFHGCFFKCGTFKRIAGTVV